MRRLPIRVRIDAAGSLEVIDPGYDMLALMHEIDPNFALRWVDVADHGTPRFLQIKKSGSGIRLGQERHLREEALWRAHEKAMDAWRDGQALAKPPDELSLLELKMELARRAMSPCRLCARQCGVDRLRGERGPCKLGPEATVAEHFVHIAEEVGPSLVLNLRGCGLRCRYCQQHRILAPEGEGDVLDASLWSKLDMDKARTMSFVGGNPDENLYGALQFLHGAPATFSLPVVWNHHAYMSEEVAALTEGIADVFVPDLKYGADACAQQLSSAPGYVAAAQRTLAHLLQRDVAVIVRILVLPGHVECCHIPSIQWLATQARRARLTVSVRGQYAPDYKIDHRDGALNRRATRAEIERVRQTVMDCGLSLCV